MTKAKSDETSQKAERPSLNELTGVKYVGSSNVREISQEAFASMGVETKGTLTWDASNDHFVAIGQMNAAAVDFLATQEDFKLV